MSVPAHASSGTSAAPPPEAIEQMGGREAFELLRELVALDTTNLEDPAHGLEEKRHYREAAELLARRARSLGLKTRIWDAREELPDGRTHFRSPRPNLIVDLERGRPHTLLLLAHMDVVPVPQEQLGRWQSPPHELTWRAPGRLYGRGSNDDLGSGVLSSFMALGRLSEARDLPANVRLLVCGDEETGGAGGIEAIAHHDQALPPDSPQRLLRAEMALIPDGAPYVAAGCSGVAFIQFGMEGSAPLSSHLSLAEGVVGFEPTARSWTSRLPSPDYPELGAPDAHITGRATLTQFDLSVESQSTSTRAELPRLERAHAESDAANQIPESVSLAFQGDPARLDGLVAFLEKHVTEPFRLVARPLPSRGTPSPHPPRHLALSVVGRAGHAGYPHRASDPVPVTVALLRAAVQEGLLDGGSPANGGGTLDLRSPPEMPSGDVIALFDNRFRLLQSELPSARYECPDDRRRSGYAIDPGHPAVVAVRRVFDEVMGRDVGTFGEYGGTDASALRELTTPGGQPLPALVVGAMDRDARIHDAEESADPRLLGQVQELLVRFLSTWTPPPGTGRAS